VLGDQHNGLRSEERHHHRQEIRSISIVRRLARGAGVVSGFGELLVNPSRAVRLNFRWAMPRLRTPALSQREAAHSA
jgi:hypothetical protein